MAKETNCGTAKWLSFLGRFRRPDIFLGIDFGHPCIEHSAQSAGIVLPGVGQVVALPASSRTLKMKLDCPSTTSFKSPLRTARAVGMRQNSVRSTGSGPAADDGQQIDAFRGVAVRRLRRRARASWP